MTQRVVWRRIAELEVVDAAVYLADDNPAAAARFMEAVDETVQSLVEMPGAGRPWEFNHPALAGMRSRLVQDFANYLVFYRPTDAGIEVLRVLHGARDIDAIFQDED
jgi:toxin ParE1/3/4